MRELRDIPAVVEICENLRNMAFCEFVGLALQEETGLNIKWHYVAGNSNEKYRLITVRFGKGIAGKVISSGSPITIDDFSNDKNGNPLEQPIMLAENLVSSFAVPLIFNGLPKGVLLVGSRRKHLFVAADQSKVMEAARALEKTLALHFASGGL